MEAMTETIIDEDFLKHGIGPDGLKKGPWTAEEDEILVEYVKKHGEGKWNLVQKNTGLPRCGKSCRLRWSNHLRPDLKKGAFSREEEALVIKLHTELGNKWARMATFLPGRTDNEIKNFWNTRIKRRIKAGLPLQSPLTVFPRQPKPASTEDATCKGGVKESKEVLPESDANPSSTTSKSQPSNSSSHPLEVSENTDCVTTVLQGAAEARSASLSATSDESPTTASAEEGSIGDSKLATPGTLSRSSSSVSSSSYTHASNRSCCRKTRFSDNKEDAQEPSDLEIKSESPEPKKRRVVGTMIEEKVPSSDPKSSKETGNPSKVKSTKLLEINTSKLVTNLAPLLDFYQTPRLITPKHQNIMEQIFQLFEEHHRLMKEGLQKETHKEDCDESDDPSGQMSADKCDAEAGNGSNPNSAGDSDSGRMGMDADNLGLFDSFVQDREMGEDYDEDFCRSMFLFNFDQNFSCGPLPELGATPALDSPRDEPFFLSDNTCSYFGASQMEPQPSTSRTNPNNNNVEMEPFCPEIPTGIQDCYLNLMEGSLETCGEQHVIISGMNSILPTEGRDLCFDLSSAPSAISSCCIAKGSSLDQTSPKVTQCHIWNLGSVPSKSLQILWRGSHQKFEAGFRGSALISPKACVNDKLPVDAFLKVMESLKNSIPLEKN